MSASPWFASHCQVVRELPYDFCAASGCVGTTCNVALWTSNVMRPAVILEDHQGFKGFATCDRHVFVAVVKMCVLFISGCQKWLRGCAVRLYVCSQRFEPQRLLTCNGCAWRVLDALAVRWKLHVLSHGSEPMFVWWLFDQDAR